ncbi:MAG TPA: hypothetical protein VFE10_11565 [Phenylobacterium sp.]|jgi:hypothetical protein|nr:hypothetical protein [Phenylobacterium sp.]
MKSMLFAALAAAVILPAATALADPAGEALEAKADACIRAQAPQVSAITPSPNEAVTFLVDGLCGVEIQRAETYNSNQRVLAQWQATMQAAALANVSVDPASGELKSPPGFSPPLNTSSMMLSTLRNITNPRAHYRALAAQAVLAAKAGARR